MNLSEQFFGNLCTAVARLVSPDPHHSEEEKAALAVVEKAFDLYDLEPTGTAADSFRLMCAALQLTPGGCVFEGHVRELKRRAQPLAWESRFLPPELVLRLCQASALVLDPGTHHSGDEQAAFSVFEEARQAVRDDKTGRSGPALTLFLRMRDIARSRRLTQPGSPSPSEVPRPTEGAQTARLDLKDLGVLNGWQVVPDVVAKCRELGHNILEISLGPQLRAIECDACRYTYQRDFGRPVQNPDVLVNPLQAVPPAGSPPTIPGFTETQVRVLAQQVAEQMRPQPPATPQKGAEPGSFRWPWRRAS